MKWQLVKREKKRAPGKLVINKNTIKYPSTMKKYIYNSIRFHFSIMRAVQNLYQFHK